MTERLRYELHEHAVLTSRRAEHIRHAHADGSTPHKHPDCGPARYDQRQQYRVKPNGPQREWRELAEWQRSFHVVFVDEYTAGHASAGISRERWEAERAAFLADMRGEAEYTTPPIATMVHEFRLRPIYELRRPDAEAKEAADDD